MQGIKVTTDNIVSVVEVDTSNFRSIINCIGCDIFEVVGTEFLNSFFNEKVVFCMDEEALLKGLPENELGSIFYGSFVHGHLICGDLLLLIRDGGDLIGFDSAYEVVHEILNYFPFLREDGGSDG